jgi:L-alanine-DL-glutamate epimerase-like enolase superfamily enzyme
MKITRIETHYLARTTRSKVSLAEAMSSRMRRFIVRIHTDTEHVGLGFTHTFSKPETFHALIASELVPLVLDEEATEIERLFTRVQSRFRASGWLGLTSRAYAALDIALWDLKAKSLGLPLYKLLGGARSTAPCFIGDAATLDHEPGSTIAYAKPLIEKGVLGVSVEVGSGEVQQDADRVQQIRDGLGEDAWIGVVADGRYDLGTALAMAHFYEEDVGIDWFDSPIPAEDRVGYRRLAERMEVPLAIGSSFDDRDAFFRSLQEGNVRVLRPDLLRIGGITPFLKIAAIAEPFHVPVVPFRLPEIGVHLACGLANVPMVEWGGWMSQVFTEPTTPVDGKLVPPSRPGHGMESEKIV